MSDQQKQGMGLIEQGMQQIIDLQVKPQVDAVNEDIKAARDEFGKIKEAADKSLQEAKNLVSSAISSEIAKIEKDTSDKLNEKQSFIDNIMHRMQKLEQSIQGKMDMCVRKDDDDKTIKFTVPDKAKAIQYYIGGNMHKAEAKPDGTFAGPHIVSSVRKNNEHVLKLNQKLDHGSSFSIDLDIPSVAQQMIDFGAQIKKIEETLGGLCDVLNKFATKVSK